jgi:hypothetical protein
MERERVHELEHPSWSAFTRVRSTGTPSDEEPLRCRSLVHQGVRTRLRDQRFVREGCPGPAKIEGVSHGDDT